MPAQNSPAQDSNLTVRINDWFDLKMKRYFGFFISIYKSAEKLFAKKGIDANDGKKEINTTESNKNNKRASDEVIFPTVPHAGSASKTVNTAVAAAQQQAGVGKAELLDPQPKKSAVSTVNQKTSNKLFAKSGLQRNNEVRGPSKIKTQFRFSPFSFTPQWQMTIPDESKEKRISTPLGIDYPSPLPFANPKRAFKPF